MNIEEIAFKDRTELAHLNGIDLLNIIEFLQKDRKQWINQFTQTHNESVEIQKENNELKKQLENYKKLGFKHLQDKNNNLENQQKEFIKYLENGIDVCDGFLDTVKSDLQEILYVVIPANKNITTRIIENETAHKIYEEILQKYKSIIGVSDENN